MKTLTKSKPPTTSAGTKSRVGVASTDLLAIASAPPREVRRELTETIEDIGSAMCLLREAVDDTERGNLGGGKMCGSDALEILSNLETRFSQMAAKLAIWSEGAIEAYGGDHEHAGECLDCGASLQLVRPGKHQCPNCG